MAFVIQPNASLPTDDPIAEQGSLKAGYRWILYLSYLYQLSTNAPVRVNNVSLSTQGASIAATDFSGSPLAGGSYRINYYARITRAATTSSSLTVAFGWTDGGVVCSRSFAAMTGNTTDTNASASFPIVIDAGTPVLYATTYASVGATSMQYKLVLSLEAMQF